MAGNKCVYTGCNNNRQECPGLRFFQISSVSIDISNQWVENTGNSSLMGLPLRSRHRKLVCENHFDKNYILQSGRLRKGALPYHHQSPKENPSTEGPVLEFNPQRIIRQYGRKPSIKSPQNAFPMPCFHSEGLHQLEGNGRPDQRSNREVCPNSLPGTEVWGSHATAESTTSQTANGKKTSGRTDDDVPAPPKKPRMSNKSEASSSAPSRRSSRVMRPKWPILPPEGTSCDTLTEFYGPVEETSEEETNRESVLEKFCRLCLEELKDFTYMFEFNEEYGFNVSDVISDLLGMDLNPDDGYPTKICMDCLEELVHFRGFKWKCFDTKAKLREMLQGSTHSNAEEETLSTEVGEGSGGMSEDSDDGEAVDGTIIKQEAHWTQSCPVTESVMESNQGHVSPCLDKVTVKQELTFCESIDGDQETFNDELMIPCEPAIAGRVTVAKDLLMACGPSSVDEVAVNTRSMIPCEPAIAGRVTVAKDLLMTREPSSVNEVAVNTRSMIPCEPTIAGRVTVTNNLVMTCEPPRVAVDKELTLTCEPIGVNEVLVKEELIMSCDSDGVSKDVSGDYESSTRKCMQKLQNERNVIEPNASCPLSSECSVPASQMSMPLKEEVLDADEECAEDVEPFGETGQLTNK